MPIEPISPGRPWRTAAFWALLAILTFQVATGRVPLINPPYHPATVSTLPTAVHSLCLGRYMVDLPKSFQQKSGGWGEIQFLYGLDKDFKSVYASVDDASSTPAQFESTVESRRAKLAAELNASSHRPMLLQFARLNSTSFLLRREADENDELGIESEVHRLVAGHHVTLQMASYDSNAKTLEEISTQNVDPAPSESRLIAIADKLKSESSGGPGFCFQGVLFDAGQDDEIARFDFKSPDAPDIQLRFDYHAVTGQPEESLFDRQRRVSSRPNYAAVLSTIRRDKTKMGGMTAQEILLRGWSAPVQHYFSAETRTEKQSLAHPTISLEMMTGQPFGNSQEARPSSISDERAYELWDQIVKSVRLRPNALPPGMTTLGESIPTCRFGDPCPRSGFWMKQIEHPDYDFNGYYAQASLHQPFKEGEFFLPESEDDPRFQPFTVWTWRRDLG